MSEHIETLRYALDGCGFHGCEWYDECEECTLRKGEHDALDDLAAELRGAMILVSDARYQRDEARAERDALREKVVAAENAGLEFLEGDFVKRDGSHSRFYVQHLLLVHLREALCKSGT